MGTDGLLNQYFLHSRECLVSMSFHKRENMIHELKMKVCLYNKMIAMQYNPKGFV